MLLGVIRGAGDLEVKASPVTGAPDTAAPSSVGSERMRQLDSLGPFINIYRIPFKKVLV